MAHEIVSSPNPEVVYFVSRVSSIVEKILLRFVLSWKTLSILLIFRDLEIFEEKDTDVTDVHIEVYPFIEFYGFCNSSKTYVRIETLREYLYVK